MNFYEIKEPYFAIIKAKDDIEATNKYIEIVAGSQEEFEEINEELYLVDREYVARKLLNCIDDATGKLLTKEQYDESLNKKEADVIMMDSSLY